MVADCIVRVSINAFTIGAWGTWFARAAEQPNSNRAWGMESWDGKVDAVQRQKFGRSASRKADQLQDACVARLRELADEFDYTRSWKDAWERDR
jgi:hypothetical protein